MTYQYVPVGNPEVAIAIGLVGVFLIFLPFLISRIYRSLHRKLKSLKKEEYKVVICGGLRKPKVKVPKPSEPAKPKVEDWTPAGPIIIPARKIKKPKIIKKKTIEIPKIEKRDLTREKIIAKWKPLLEILEKEGEIAIDSNFHYGGLRGYDVATKLKKDLKKIGIKTKIKGDEKRAVLVLVTSSSSR